MKRFLILAILLSGCGKFVSVPPAHVGRVLTSTGYQEELKRPSGFRLPFNLVNKPKLVLVETSDNQNAENIKVYIPIDKLNMSFDVRGTFSISDEADRINMIFERVTPDGEGRVFYIRFKKVFAVYAEQIVRTRCREIATKYSIQEMMENRAAVSAEMEEAVKKALMQTPITVIRFGMADMQPPPVIVKAQEAAKKREVEIQQAEADKLVRLTEASAALEVAKKQQEVDLIEAETQVMVNMKLSEGVNEAFVVQRALKILEAMARSDNKIFIVPTDALHTPSLMIGVNQEALRELGSKSQLSMRKKDGE